MEILNPVSSSIGGLGWLTFLWRPLARSLQPYILAPGMLGEGSLTLCLLIKSVDVPLWQAGEARNLGLAKTSSAADTRDAPTRQ